MKYMVLMYSNPAQTQAMSASELDAVMRKHDALRDELTESGELLSGPGSRSGGHDDHTVACGRWRHRSRSAHGIR